MKPLNFVTLFLLLITFSCSEDPVLPDSPNKQTTVNLVGQWRILSAVYDGEPVTFGANRSVTLVLAKDSSYVRTEYLVVDEALTQNEIRGAWSVTEEELTFSSIGTFTWALDTIEAVEHLSLLSEDTEEVFEKIYR